MINDLSIDQHQELNQLRTYPDWGSGNRHRDNIRKQLKRMGLIYFDRKQWIWRVYTPKEEIPLSEIFVFGSNLGGYHGAGAARFAIRNKGAILGQATGLQGTSYAIPTKDANIKHTLPLDEIQGYVDTFKQFARQHKNLTFQVTRIGCGLAGLRDDMIAPMFVGSPFNCRFDNEWEKYLGDRYDYWGTF